MGLLVSEEKKRGWIKVGGLAVWISAVHSRATGPFTHPEIGGRVEQAMVAVKCYSIVATVVAKFGFIVMACWRLRCTALNNHVGYILHIA